MKTQLTILGAGISGFGAAKLALKHGFSVFVSDAGQLKDEVRSFCVENQIEYEEGGHSFGRISSSAEVVKSPGISPETDIVKELIEKGVPVIDELEFAGRYSTAKKILITGTNGKTTTTLLVNHLLKTAGVDSVAVGNVGNSFAEELYLADHEAFVVEVSSFQLDGMERFRADVAVLLNITEDHLNRYGNMESYVDSKHRIENLLVSNGLFIYNGDSSLTFPFKTNSEEKNVSLKNKRANAYLDEGKIVIKEEHCLEEIRTDEFTLKGEHNYFNAMCAILAVRKIGLHWNDIRRGLASFDAVPHRLQKIKQVAGVNYVNDSKATNVDATRYALNSFDNKLIWIVGGVDKGNDYNQILNLVKDNVKAIVCLGKDNLKIVKAFSGVVNQIGEATSMGEAVQLAADYANAGDVVLLSPACASFDLFENYVDRGEKFIIAVENLDAGKKEVMV